MPSASAKSGSRAGGRRSVLSRGVNVKGGGKSGASKSVKKAVDKAKSAPKSKAKANPHFETPKRAIRKAGGVSRKAMPARKAPVSKKLIIAAEMAGIVERISGWAGGPRQALAWCREVGIPALGGQTAEELVKAGQARSVMTFLDHIAVGGFA